MNIVNIHEAKTHLSRLIEAAVRGEPFIIARAGTPLVKVTALEAPPSSRRLGFMATEADIPADFDSIGAADIEAQFNGPASAE